MINDDLQKQEGGDNSSNLQARSIVINQGISYSDAKEIALDVYRANFLQLSSEASSIAVARAEQLTDQFLKKLQAEKPEGVASMRDPGMQIALFSAQKEYAKSGDKDMEGLLVDILVNRASQTDRNIRQIVLDEALVVAPKLTIEQLVAVTLNFTLSKLQFPSIRSLHEFNIFVLDCSILPFADFPAGINSCVDHLVYAGCASKLDLYTLTPPEDHFRMNYPAFFSKGFTRDAYDSAFKGEPPCPGFIMPALHNRQLFQFQFMNDGLLRRNCAANNLSTEITDALSSLFSSSAMSGEETKAYLIRQRPKFAKVMDIWKETGVSKFNLTTVGIAISHANLRRKSPSIKLDLSIWVN
jgi:hypothetical protein